LPASFASQPASQPASQGCLKAAETQSPFRQVCRAEAKIRFIGLERGKVAHWLHCMVCFTQCYVVRVGGRVYLESPINVCQTGLVSSELAAQVQAHVLAQLLDCY
jgi:hypothetical protein